MRLNEIVSGIQTREDFIHFLHALLDDLRAQPEQWENPTLEGYLEAMAAWGADAEGYYANQGIPVPLQARWKSLAEMLLAAKSYE